MSNDCLIVGVFLVEVAALILVILALAGEVDRTQEEPENAAS